MGRIAVELQQTYSELWSRITDSFLKSKHLLATICPPICSMQSKHCKLIGVDDFDPVLMLMRCGGQYDEESSSAFEALGLGRYSLKPYSISVSIMAAQSAWTSTLPSLISCNFPGANWKMGAVRNFTSNPYCVLRLGGTSIKTSTVKNSTNPDWPDEDAAYFIVHNREQELQAFLGTSRWNLW